MSRVLLLWVISIMIGRPVQAQNNLWISYEVFSEKEGFQNYFGPGVITQDREGLLWIGGDNGLFSFDGTWFTNYRHQAGNDSSLPMNVVTVNYQDKHGDYWTVLPNKGLYRYNPLQRTFSRFTYPGIDRFDIHQHRIAAFVEDGDLLWMVLTDYGLASWNRRTNKLVPYKICPPGSCGNYLSASWVTAMVKDRVRNCFWIGSNDGLVQFRPERGELQVYRPAVDPRDKTPISPIFNYLLMDETGALWCGSWGNGLLRFDGDSKQFKRYLWHPKLSGTKNICSGIYAGNAKQLWVSTRDEGLLLFDKPSGSFRKLRSPDRPDEVIEAAQSFQSNAHTIWLADQRKLYRLNLDTTRFQWHPLPAAGSGVFNFLHTNGQLYTGTFYEGSFGLYDRTNGRFVPRRLTDALIPGNLQHLSQDKEGRVWIGTHGGAFLLDPKTNDLITPVTIDSSQRYFKANCFDVIHTRDGSHWMATTKGVFRYNEKTLQTTVFDANQSAKHRLPGLPVYDLYEDRKGRIWMGNQRAGLICYFPDKDSIINRPLRISPGKEKCGSFCEDKDGRMLFVAEGLGMIILEQAFTAAEKLTLCNTSNYLPTDYINAIIRDHRQRIWLNTANGLLLFDPITKKYTAFRKGDGLQDNFIDSSPYQDSTNMMYIGFSQGFQTFHPDSILLGPNEKVRIRVNSLLVDGKPWPQQPAYLSEIVLQPGQTNISFTFSAVTHSLSHNYNYAYRLDGFDDNWINTGSEATGQYSNLPPGQYRLRIKAAIGSNQWISEYAALRVISLPAWYQTVWFKSAVVLLVIGIMYAMFRRRLKQVKREAALKESYNKRINELEMRSLRAQMNPHFIFNSLSSINRYIVKSDHKTASSYLTKFSRLIRLILDNTAADYISLEKEIQTLQLYIELEAMRFDNAFSYSINVDSLIDQQETMIPSMILQPYVENAIWHGLLHKEAGRGMLTISISQVTLTQLMAQIEDNGVGRQQAKEMKSKEAVKKKSYGMQISHDRLELLSRLNHGSASIAVEDLADAGGMAAGTRVIIHIPVQNSFA